MNLENKKSDICSKCGSKNINQDDIKKNSSIITMIFSSIFSFIMPLIILIHDLIKSIFSLKDEEENKTFHCNDCGHKW